MNTEEVLLLRAATRLQASYVRQRADMELPCHDWLHLHVQPHLDRVYRCERLLQLARARRFTRSAARLQDQLAQALSAASHSIDMGCRQLPKPASPVPTLRALYEELMATRSEFGGLDWNRAENRLSVETDPIRLEGICLGPFRIDLCLDEIGGTDAGDWFRVEALEPNPAASNEDVPHPHVDSGHLCAGDAWHPLRRALMDGRLSEFFTIIRSVLETYNPQSPYVNLEDWDGRSCADCGYTVHEDGVSWCDGCEQDFCEECISSCCACDATLCRRCLTECQVCDDAICESCAEPCRECGDNGCPSCLEDGLCSTCNQEQEATDDNPEGDQASSQSDQGASTVGIPTAAVEEAS